MWETASRTAASLLRCVREFKQLLRMSCSSSQSSPSFVIILFVVNGSSFAGFITLSISALYFVSRTPKLQLVTYEDPRNILSLRRVPYIRRGCELLLHNNATHGLKVKTLELLVVTVRTARPNVQEFCVLHTEGMFSARSQNCYKRVLAL